VVDADVDTGETRMAIGAIGHERIDFDCEPESAPRFWRFGVLKEARCSRASLAAGCPWRQILSYCSP
jgi:hypothetical protein